MTPRKVVFLYPFLLLPQCLGVKGMLAFAESNG